MARIDFRGIDQYMAQLSALGRVGADKAIRYAIYPAAQYVADEIKAAVPVSDDPRSSGDLRDGLILTHMRDDNGFIHTVCTFAGYDSKGAPLPLVARVLESGRSTPEGKVGKHPFIRGAVNRTKARAERLMQAALDQYLSNYLQGRSE